MTKHFVNRVDKDDAVPLSAHVPGAGSLLATIIVGDSAPAFIQSPSQGPWGLYALPTTEQVHPEACTQDCGDLEPHVI